ncbi:hypothetical protein [Actinomycetospora lemnae]|uniref:Glycosyl transferase family 2 n=1 Tax=Actinomycetospora lemnae TaxID=3019891 RepID=A0ABT5SU53_9PSEU|nr:hypothetical protein [Actinomycetospora sp. DW7H6]MDD7966385.1 hypothetical protein [Actinomycetospora sp. DW7H6]
MTSSAPGALVFTVSGERPGYLAEVVASWRRVRGVEAWPVTFLVEPGTRVPECRTVITDAFPDATVVVHPERQGVRANPHRALATAFDGGAGFAVLAEEDIVVGDDVLEYLGHGAAAHRDDPSVLALCAFSPLPAPQPEDAVGTGGFTAWVWGTWVDRWRELLEPHWFDAAVGPEPGVEEGFDFGIDRMRQATARRILMPLASRSDNIGQYGGVHALPEEFEESRAATFAAHRPPQRFREVPVGVAPALARRGAPGHAGSSPLPSWT